MDSAPLCNRGLDAVCISRASLGLWPLTRRSTANFGSNGATTGTIVTRGLYGQALDTAKAEVQNGKSVFVTIQFGHSESGRVVELLPGLT